MHDDGGLSIRGGFFDRNGDAFPFRKAQYVTVKQSLLQRRRRLATLEIGLATETVSVPYIDHGIACRLRNLHPLPGGIELSALALTRDMTANA